MNRLKQLRKERNLTQEELAFQLNTTQQQISKIEKGKVSVNEKMILACIDFFGVTADYLLGVSDVRVEIGIEFVHPNGRMGIELLDLLHYYDSLNQIGQGLLREIAKVIVECHEKNERHKGGRFQWTKE